jgi:hypothetical protein
MTGAIVRRPPDRARDSALSTLSKLTYGITTAALVASGAVSAVFANELAAEKAAQAEDAAGHSAAAGPAKVRPTPLPRRTVYLVVGGHSSRSRSPARESAARPRSSSPTATPQTSAAATRRKRPVSRPVAPSQTPKPVATSSGSVAR